MVLMDTPWQQDRRQCPRTRVSWPMIVQAGAMRYLTSSVDISPFGAKVRTKARLKTGTSVRLEVVPGRLEAMVRLLPDTVPRVAESGVATAADAGRIAIAGYDVALVGSALMASLEPHQLVRAMISAGRTERARRS